MPEMVLIFRIAWKHAKGMRMGAPPVCRLTSAPAPRQRGPTPTAQTTPMQAVSQVMAAPTDLGNFHHGNPRAGSQRASYRVL